MRYSFVFYIFMILSFANISLAQDEQLLVDVKSITVTQAIEYALINNPDLQSKAKNIDLATENIDLAKSGFRPTVTANAGVTHSQMDNNITNNWSGSTQKSIGVGVSQPLFRGGQTMADIDQQQSLKIASEKLFTKQTQDKIVEIVDTYMTTYRAYQAKAVNADNVTLLQEELKATEARFDAGELTKTDVSQAKAQLAQAIAEESEASAVYEVALSGFRAVTGIQEAIELEYPDIDMTKMPESLDSALSIGLRKNPNIASAMAQIDAQDAQITEDKGAFYPQISLDAVVTLDRDPAFSQFDEQKRANVGVRATVPLYQAGVLRNTLRQSKITRAQRENDLESVRRSVSDEIIAAWERYRATSIQIDAREAQLEASKLAYEGIKLEEQVGARSVLDVLDTSQDVRNAELGLIDAKSNRVKAYYALLGAMGVLNETFWDNSETML